MIKKLSIVISLSLWSGAAAFADNGLVVSYAGGESDEFVLSQIAGMAFEDGNLKIISDREAPRLISLATIARMNFSDKVSIETVSPDASDIVIAYDRPSETLTFSGLPEQTTPVDLWSADGRLVIYARLSPGEILPVGTLPPGLYIVRAGTTTFKFVR